MSFKAPIVKHEKRKAAGWLSSMGDMLALLLTFFVLLFSVSNLVNQDFISSKTIADIEELRKVANQFDYSYAVDFKRDPIEQPTRYIYKILVQHIKTIPGFENVNIALGKGWINISIYNDLLFHPDGDRLTPAGKILLLDLIDLLIIYKNRIEIVANVSPNSTLLENISSRWILGLAYANTVRQYFFDNGIVRSLAIGTRTRPIAEQVSLTFSPEEREKLVNRIEIVIYDIK
ncbi:MAG: hypothetical protein K0U45_10070 [Alphaproteobacteria bacterium]|nr:hypothetical protein [Alphaproteobacteria bacterium]